LPGSVYVLVSAMAGSIITRNRNILLRFSVPLAVGIGTGWIVLPITMTNIGNLCWRYEERVPVIKDVHLRTRAFIEEAVKMGKEGSKEAVQAVEGGAQSVREGVEGLISGKK
jgi:organizing structure protein 2